MKRAFLVVAALAVCVAGSAAYDYGVIDAGTWPKSWPAELESLRKQSRTLEGPLVLNQHFAIRFNKREEFEAAWPHILKVKTKGAPLVLVRGRNFFLGDDHNAGVVVHSPPLRREGETAPPEAPIPGVENERVRWMNANYIELVVDGEIVDLNRIPLPADTPIIDERFKESVNP